MDERELSERFEAVGVPPSRLEVGALVAAGRRRVTRRRSWQAAGGAALAIAVLVAVPSILFHPRNAAVVAVGSPSSEQPAEEPTGQPTEAPPIGTTAVAPSSAPAAACAMSVLATPKGMTRASVTAVDPTGRYIIGHDIVGQNFHPILWTDGKPQALPMRGESVELSAVNANGVVVGLVSEGASEYAFRYQNGKYTRLRTPSGNWHIYPVPAINTAGDVVINAEPSGNSGGKDSFALLWNAGSTTAKRLPLPDGANVMAILDDGTLVGALYKNGEAIAGYAWDQQGHGRKLTTPSGQTAAAYAGRGDWATGGFWPRQSVARWNLRTGEMKEFETPAAADVPSGLDGIGPGERVNAAGWVVASGFVLRDDGPAELTVPTGQKAQPIAVSDYGLVVGGTQIAQSLDNGNLGPRTWKC
ncbi:hypothetical protein ACIA5D_13270 [Actinoplanes sp. NPDC051513]|uniref:hypothetical protein n=1 Tax=Actinoplanes sp. NPDC051513 TaxID=3363908 RepID=UPI0037BB9528